MRAGAKAEEQYTKLLQAQSAAEIAVQTAKLALEGVAAGQTEIDALALAQAKLSALETQIKAAKSAIGPIAHTRISRAGASAPVGAPIKAITSSAPGMRDIAPTGARSRIADQALSLKAIGLDPKQMQVVLRHQENAAPGAPFSIAAPDDKAMLLAVYKAAATAALKKYSLPWGLSWLGHHHEGRVLAVIKAINDDKITTVDEIKRILTRQRVAVSTPASAPASAASSSTLLGEQNRSVTEESYDVSTDVLANRWQKITEVRRHTEARNSGYVRAVGNALESINTIASIAKDTAGQDKISSTFSRRA